MCVIAPVNDVGTLVGSYLTTAGVHDCRLFLFVRLMFDDVAFSRVSCTMIAVSSLCGEYLYVVRVFLPDGVFSTL